MTTLPQGLPTVDEFGAPAPEARGDANHPALGSHVVFRRVVRTGEVQWVAKNPERDEYYTFPDWEWKIIELFDGTRTRSEILAEYRKISPEADMNLVLDYEEILRAIHFIQESVEEKGLRLVRQMKESRQRKAEEKTEGRNIFLLTFKVFDPNRMLDRSWRWFRWIWTPPTVLAWVIMSIFTVAVFVQNFDPIFRETIELYSFLKKPLIDVIQFFFILCFIGFIHEMAHAYACKIYGGEVHHIGIALLYFTPAFYCDTTDSLLFQNRWHRLWVMVAGIYVEGFICAGATALWVASYPDTLLHELAYKTMLFTGISTIFFNINPLIKIDGYYSLASVIEIPELREESFRYIGLSFQKHILRLPVTVPIVSTRKKRWYWGYGSLALMYLITIMGFIAGLFNNLYTKYFGQLSIIFLIVTLYKIFNKRIRLGVRVAKLFYLDKKDLIMSRRARLPLIAAGCVVLLILAVPWSRIVIPVRSTLQPVLLARLTAPDSGVVADVFVKEGELVQAGQPILRLANPRSESERLELEAQRTLLERQARAAREAASPGEAARSEIQDEALEAAVRSKALREQALLIRTPIAGTVMTHRLEDLTGTYVAAGDVLVEVGDASRVMAELPVSERLLQFVTRGAEVKAYAPSAGTTVLRGTIARISPATMEDPRKPKSSVVEVQPQRFNAVAIFDAAPGRTFPGASIRAKLYGPRRSYLSRAYHILRDWVLTIVW